MSKLKLIPILLFVSIFAYLLSLPSAKSTVNKSEVQKQLLAMPDFNYIDYGVNARDNMQLAKACTIFRIVETNKDTSKLANEEINTTVKQLAPDPSMLAKLKMIGNSTTLKHSSWNDKGEQNLSQFFNEKNINMLSKELLFDTNNFNDFLVTLRDVNSIIEVMPKSKIAFDLLKVAESTNILTDELKLEIANSIKTYNKSDVINPALLEDVLDRTIPTLELMKTCKTWNQFATLMSQVKSPRHVSILLSLAKSSNDATKKLSQILITVEENPELIGAILGYVNDKGVNGLNNLYKAILKGTKGLNLLINNPNEQITDLNILKNKKQCPIRKWWTETAKASPLPMELVRYLLMTLSICAVMLFGVQTQHLARVLLIKDPENASKLKVATQLFLVIFTIFAICFIFNYFVTPKVDSQQTANMASSGSKTISSPATTQQNALTGISILSLVIIIFMQFTVYAKAISELKKIKELSGTAKLKLKQLTHADIFFDLPIYLGLLGTVSSFIIMLFDPAASRIVAYSSTIIGIIFSASLRIFYVYPLQKELTNETENNCEKVEE